jgi:hypothetical protein
VPLHQQEGQFDLALEVDANKDLISVLRYNPQVSRKKKKKKKKTSRDNRQIFHQENIELLGNHLVLLMSNLCANLSSPFSSINALQLHIKAFDRTRNWIHNRNRVRSGGEQME